MRIQNLLLIPLLTSLFCCRLYAQDSSAIKTQQVPIRFLESVHSKASKLEGKLSKKTEKFLIAMQREENKLKKKLYRIDSLAANNLFALGTSKYEEFQKKLQQKTVDLSKSKMGNYIPFLDTVKTSLAFLQNNSSATLPQVAGVENKLKETIEKVDLLKGGFDQAGTVQQFIRERKQYLKEQLSKFGMAKDLKILNKKAYYYSQLVKDYKEIFSNPKKIEKHAMALLNKSSFFKKFLQKNSALASIFGSPSGNSNAPSISFAGLQTRASVQQIVSSSTLTNGSNPAQYISQQLQTANEQLSALKSKIAFVDLSGNPEPMPDFKVNEHKTKSFLKRIELGGNVQFGNVNRVMPTTGDFALSAGYKLNTNGVIGIASAYKLGLGSIKRIQLSNQGFSIRSFIDWKIKGGFYVSGGYEKNYLPQMQNLLLPQPPELWQESGLVGITKKYSISKKRKFNTQLLFDFLSYKNFPRSQPIIFRTGWTF